MKKSNITLNNTEIYFIVECINRTNIQGKHAEVICDLKNKAINNKLTSDDYEAVYSIIKPFCQISNTTQNKLLGLMNEYKEKKPVTIKK